MFFPRIADVGGTGFWRADIPGQPAGDYGPLNAIARNKVNLDRIVTHWPDMGRGRNDDTRSQLVDSWAAESG